MADEMERPQAVTAVPRRSRIPRTDELWTFLRHLSYPTRISALRAMVDGVLVTHTLRTRGVRSLLVPTGTARTLEDPERAERIGTAVDAAFGVIPVAPTCLRRSLTLIRELNRLGLGAILHIGVRSVAGSIEAHAWVQVGGIVVNDDPAITGAYVELAGGELEELLPLLR